MVLGERLILWRFYAANWWAGLDYRVRAFFLFAALGLFLVLPMVACGGDPHGDALGLTETLFPGR